MRHVFFPALALSLITAGCSTTLHMRSGVELDGHIESADHNYVYVVLDETPTSLKEQSDRMANAEPRWGVEGRRDNNGRLFRVRRDQVKSMDYPGFGVAVAGTVLQVVGFGGGFAGLAAAASCRGSVCAIAPFFLVTMPGITLGGAGTAMMGAGWTVYAHARADSDPSSTVNRVRFKPFAAPTPDGGMNGGAQTTLTW